MNKKSKGFAFRLVGLILGIVGIGVWSGRKVTMLPSSVV